ncbi:hypothetical protein D3C71_1629450 [compost metagenome]
MLFRRKLVQAHACTSYRNVSSILRKSHRNVKKTLGEYVEALRRNTNIIYVQFFLFNLYEQFFHLCEVKSFVTLVSTNRLHSILAKIELKGLMV